MTELIDRIMSWVTNGYSLVLSSGGIKGLLHVGILRFLEEEGLLPEEVIGCSAGALAGAFFSASLSTREMEDLLRTRLLDLKDLNLKPGKALIKREKVLRVISLLPERFSLLKKKLLVTATSLDGERIVFSKGNLHEAVYASITVPGVFPALEKVIRGKKRVLVDGAFTGQLPVDLATSRNALCDYLEHGQESNPLIGAVNASMKYITMKSIKEYREKGECLLLTPRLRKRSVYYILHPMEGVMEGYEYAKRHASRIKSFISG